MLLLLTICYPLSSQSSGFGLVLDTDGVCRDEPLAAFRELQSVFGKTHFLQTQIAVAHYNKQGIHVFMLL